MRPSAAWLMGAALCLLAAPALRGASAVDDSIQSKYLDIYLRMNSADQAQMNGDLRGALSGFEDCYTRLTWIHAHYPDWENVLVTKRMGDCEARVKLLEAKLTATQPRTPAAAVAGAKGEAAVSGRAAAQAKLAELQAEVKAAPRNAAAVIDLGVVYYQLGQMDSAIDALQKGVALQPTNVYGHNYLGCALSRKGRVEAAAKEFRAALDLDEGFTEAHYNLAILYATEDPPAMSAARMHYKRALELGMVTDPHLAHVLHLTGN